jgi:hypothetical protein
MVQTADFDHTQFAQGREAEADAALMVKFFMREKEDTAASQEAGRPIYKDREYVEIRVPGKRDPLVCRPATAIDKTRFPRHYDMFKRRVEAPTEGTPLAEWPQISRSMAEELSFLQVKTVEQFVQMSDGDAANIRGGLGLKEKAKDFLKYADKNKLITEKQALETRLADQESEMVEMRKMMQEMRGGKTSDAPADIDTAAVAPEPRVRKTRRPAPTEE